MTDLVKSRIKDGGGHLPELILAYVIKETLNVSIKDLSINLIVKTAEQQRYARTVSQSRFIAQNLLIFRHYWIYTTTTSCTVTSKGTTFYLQQMDVSK